MALTRRQREIFDFVREFIGRNGYSPSLEEIGRHFNLSSVATVHKHVTNLVRKGLLRRSWNQNRSIEIVDDERAPRAVEVPMIGTIPAGTPHHADHTLEAISIPSWLVGSGRTFVLKVSGDSMGGEHVQDGDFVIVEERRSAEAGQLVVAMIRGENLTLRKYYPEADMTRLESGGAPYEPIVLPTDRVEVRGVVRGVIRKC